MKSWTRKLDHFQDHTNLENLTRDRSKGSLEYSRWLVLFYVCTHIQGPRNMPLPYTTEKRATIIQSLSKGETAHGSWCHGQSPSIRGKITTSQDVPSGAYPEFTPKNGSSPRFSFRGVHVGCRISPNPPPPSRSHERI